MSKKIMAMVLLVLVIGAAAGGYFYLQQQQKAAHIEVPPQPAEDDYVAFVRVSDIYYSSNNGKRSKLIAMDIVIEVNEEIIETLVKRNAPKIKSEVLKILATEAYKDIDDQFILTFINENINKDLDPLLKRVAGADAYSQVYVTKLIIQ